MLITFLALAASAAAAPKVPAGPGFDCQKARAADEQLVCEEPELAALDRRMSVLFSWGVFSQDGQLIAARREDQRAWMKRRAACVDEAGAPSARAEQLTGLRAAYEERIAELGRAVGPAPDALLVLRRQHHARTKTCAEVEITWPELQSTALPGAAAFNAYFAVEVKSPECVDPKDAPEAANGGWLHISSLPLWRSARFVSLARRYEEYHPGTPHPMHAVTFVTFDLERGRIVGPEDVFTSDRRLRAKLLALLTRRLTEDVREPDPEAVRKTAFTPGHWAFTAEGAEVIFSPYEVGGYANGYFGASLTWEELGPFLRAGAPLPEPR